MDKKVELLTDEEIDKLSTLELMVYYEALENLEERVEEENGNKS